MTGFSRRETLGLMAAGAVAAPLRAGSSRPEVIVVGAGVFGTWTAEQLRRRGKRVLLLDAWGPAHSRASSGGESRMTRAGYGKDAIYTRLALASLDEWKALSARAALPLFHATGVLMFFHRDESYARDSIAVHERLGLPLEKLDSAALARRWPQIDWTGITFGLFEPGFGALMARRSVETLAGEFVRGGGTFRRVLVRPPGAGTRLERLITATGEELRAEHYVFACGPWLPKLFPQLLGQRIFPTRQEIFYFAPPAGDERFGPMHLPGWADFDGDFYYGFPDLEGRGFKIANDAHGVRVDPDANDRRASGAGLEDVRGYMARRFPALSDSALTETRVCQYENSANGDFLIDRHPDWANVVLVGGGSGHGFKHGPEVGRLSAELILDERLPDPRFSLASKGTAQDRSVH